MHRTKRVSQVNVRLSQLELARMEALVEHYGIDASSVLRMLLKRDTVDKGLEVVVDTGAPQRRIRREGS